MYPPNGQESKRLARSVLRPGGYLSCIPFRADGVWVVTIMNGRIILVVGGRGGGCESVAVDLVVCIRGSVRRWGDKQGIQRFDVVRRRECPAVKRVRCGINLVKRRCRRHCRTTGHSIIRWPGQGCSSRVRNSAPRRPMFQQLVLVASTFTTNETPVVSEREGNSFVGVRGARTHTYC